MLSKKTYLITSENYGMGMMEYSFAFMKIICISSTSCVGNWTEIVLIIVNHVTDITNSPSEFKYIYM